MAPETVAVTIAAAPTLRATAQAPELMASVTRPGDAVPHATAGVGAPRTEADIAGGDGRSGRSAASSGSGNGRSGAVPAMTSLSTAAAISAIVRTASTG